MNALAGMDLLIKEKGFYKNTLLTSKYLVLGSEMFIGDHLSVYNIGSGFDDLDLTRLVKEGPDNENKTKKGLEACKVFGDFAEMMKAQQRGGRAKEIADMVSALPEFSGFKKNAGSGRRTRLDRDGCYQKASRTERGYL